MLAKALVPYLACSEMADISLVYSLPEASWSLRLPPATLEFLRSRVQTRWFSKESVGQLYSKNLVGSAILVDAVTKLPTKSAWYTGVRLDMAAVNKEREQMFSEGLHCLGFWHTHPEPVPHLSQVDRDMAAAQAMAGQAEFTGLVFVIVGTASFPQGLGVWVHDGTTLWQAGLEAAN